VAPQLGPGFLRRAPRGWVVGRAFPVEHRVFDDPHVSKAVNGIELSMRLDALWEVRVDGREPYRFREERAAPNWCDANTHAGKRWYRLRVRETHGLMAPVGVPVHVNPSDPHDLWIDWDAAYDEHVEAWKRKDRVDLAVARRGGTAEGLIHRVMTPLAGNLKPGEEHLVDEAIADAKAREAERFERDRPRREAQLQKMGLAPVAAGEQAEHDRRTAEAKRIYEVGRPARATVISNEDSGRKLMNVPVILITLEIEDAGTVRTVVFEYVWGPRPAKRYKPGKRIEVRIDPQDPGAVALAS
jgi:hypothetical protein